MSEVGMNGPGMNGPGMNEPGMSETGTNEAAAQIARFERYVEADPDNATLWVAYGDALHRAGLLERAEQAFRRSLQLDSASAIAAARLAAVEISRGNFAAAEGALRGLIEAGEQDAAVWFNLGLTLYCQRRFKEALEVFERLSPSPSPALADARYYLISCLHNLERLDEAASRAEAFLAQQPSAKLRGYLALVQMDASRMTQALEHARLALQEQPDNPDACAVLGTHCIETQKMDEAQRHLRALVEREPQNLRGWQGLALVALYRQQHEEAVGLLQKARQCDRANTGTIATLGWVHVAQHQYARAEQVFREGLQIDRNDAELHGALATALVFQRRVDEAKQECARALGLDKRCFGALFAQSIMLRLAGREQLATRLFANMLQSSARPDGPTLLDGLVAYWKQQGVIPAAPARRERP